jgi:hypothetical protein
MGLPNLKGYKNMNKLFISIGLAVSCMVAQAQNHTDASFLNVKSLQMSNNTSVVFSNIATFSGMSNVFGLVYTNLSGTRVRITNAADYTKLAKDVPLWFDRDGNAPVKYIPDPLIATSTNFLNITGGTLVGKFIGGSAANSAVTFVFRPVWYDGNQFLATTHDWSVAVTAASGVVTFATNAPMYRWPGAKYLRLISIIDADTDGAGQVELVDLHLVGFVP